MKTNKLIPLLLVVMMGTMRVSAQTKPLTQGNNELKFDFFVADGKLPADFTIPKGANVHYRIENINKNLYTITINNTDKSLFTDKPAIFNVLTNVDVSKLSQVVPPAPAGGAALAAKAVFKKGAVSDELYKASNDYYDKQQALAIKIDDYINAQYAHLKDLNLFYKNLSDLLSDDCRTFTAIRDSKIAMTTAILNTDFAYAGPYDEASLGGALKSTADGLFTTLESTYSDIIKMQGELKVLKAKYDQLLPAEADKLKAKAKGKKGKNDLASQLESVKIEQAELAASDAVLQDAIDQVKSANTAIGTLKQGDFSINAKKVYDKINVSNFTYISPSFRASKDLMEIKLTIEPKAQLVCAGNYAAFNTDVQGKVTGFKMNFSTGLFLLAGRHLFDQSYRTEPIDGDANNNKIVQNVNKTSVAPAVGALMHFYNQGIGNVNWGGSFGLSINNDTKLNYHAGISALVGDDNRFVITLGGTLAKVKLLTDDYQVGGNISKTISTVPTNDYYRGGFFFSFTYNLSN